ncbi:MAG: hypothetical protein ACI9XP_001327 [Lentimonas sp.]|jgi:uncharacterized protein YbaP (TraB family)
MTKTLLYFLLALSFNANSQLNNESVYWKIESPKSGNTSFLLGTMHLIDRDKLFLPKVVSKDLKKSDLVILEVIEEVDNAMALEMVLLKEGRMVDYVLPNQLDSFYYYVQHEFGLDSAQFENSMGRFSPMMFGELPTMKHAKGSEGIDALVEKFAKKKEIKLFGLESAELQMKFFNQIPSLLFNEMIMEVIRDSMTTKQRWLYTQELYLTQNVKEMMGEESNTVDDFTDILLTKRNLNWVVQLKNLLEEQDNFIAVGAAHLYGSIGLINLLRNEGYTCTPIKISLIK